MVIEYGTNESWRWSEGIGVVEFNVVDGDRRIVCRISKECISDNLGDPETGLEVLDTAKAHFDKITDIVGLLISRGRYEADGSILIRTEDWRS